MFRRSTQWERLRSFAFAEVGGQVSFSVHMPSPAAPKLDAWLSKDSNSYQPRALGGMNLVLTFWARWNTEEPTISLSLSPLDFEDDGFLLSFAWLDSGIEPWSIIDNRWVCAFRGPQFFGYESSVGVLFKQLWCWSCWSFRKPSMDDLFAGAMAVFFCYESSSWKNSSWKDCSWHLGQSWRNNLA